VPENPWQNMVDLKRANNIGIMLSHMKLSLNQLHTAIMHLDESILTREKVSQLIKNCPTEDEINLLSQFSGDPKELGKVESFLLKVGCLP